MKKKFFGITVISIMIVLILPYLNYLADVFFRAIGTKYPYSNISSYFFTCTFLLSYATIVNPFFLVECKKMLAKIISNAIMDSLLMETCLVLSIVMFLKLVPVVNILDIKYSVWLLSLGWFFLLSIIASLYREHKDRNKRIDN